MPIDFERIPPRADVPMAPRPSALLWLALLCLALCIGATITVLSWTGGSPVASAWFWLCAVGYPVLGWSFLLAASLAYGHTALHSALARNWVSEQAEQACHTAASRPLAIFGYGWRFSSDKEENSLQSLLGGKVESKLRPSGAFPGKDVHARWIDVPGEPFYPGNELGEHTRHLAVCDWLIASLLNDLAEPLADIPWDMSLHVHLCLQSRLKPERVVKHVRRELYKRHPLLKTRVEYDQTLSIFATDAWLDLQDEKVLHLVIAMQLREAISTLLDAGVAEVGTALLLGEPTSLKGTNVQALRLHRPARGEKNEVGNVLGLASRWGEADTKNLDSMWIQGLPADDFGEIRRAASLQEGTPWRQIEASVGDCAGAGQWLASALAAANADSTANPQLVLCAQDNELIALVCRKET
ncbi:hypothetical protein QCE49_33370 [Caballeronia sp. LZ008]|uniref:hypothetical protein n=1 Tax=unclassified Caballeronia TaxID=2646786 RepID=UPI002027B391|nr:MULTISPECIES: hypothetical protein [unclassified Caballeronia]MDR5798292.1 hypothetical protein [Caballeronia sp. LZ008]